MVQLRGSGRRLAWGLATRGPGYNPGMTDHNSKPPDGTTHFGFQQVPLAVVMGDIPDAPQIQAFRARGERPGGDRSADAPQARHRTRTLEAG